MGNCPSRQASSSTLSPSTTSSMPNMEAKQDIPRAPKVKQDENISGSISEHLATLEVTLKKIKSITEHNAAYRTEINGNYERNKKQETDIIEVNPTEINGNYERNKKQETDIIEVNPTGINWNNELNEKQKAAIIAVINVNGSTIITDTNILHEIALQGDKFETYRHFTEWLLEQRQISNVLLQHKSLLYHRRPLHLAIERGNSEFVKMILNHFEGQTSSGEGDNLPLETLLRPTTPKVDELNCVHLAIKAQSPHTIRIIEKCEEFKEEIFKQGKGEKKEGTPLHYAVLCDAPTQSKQTPKDGFKALEVIEKLIAICPDALYEINSTGLTPYQLRINALGKEIVGPANKSMGSEERKENQALIDTTINGVFKKLYKNSEGIEIKKPSQQIQGSVKDSSLENKNLKGDTHKDDASKADTSKGDGSKGDASKDVASKDVASKDVASKDVASKDVASKDDAAKDDAAKDDAAKDDASKDKAKVLREKVINDPILCVIREYCVRNLDRFKLVKALYQGAQERETYFDLSTQRNLSISQSDLRKLAGHLKFECILRYVALPRITVTGKPTIQKPRDSQRGRWDITEVFQWLRDNGVKKILSIIVIDHIEPSHSDVAIEKALGVKEKNINEIVADSFDIETWDWKKIDINCDVIARCAPSVREVSLYCSGSNAVLMGWSSTSGLRNKAKFPKLERVNLLYRQGLEDNSRLEKYVSDFKTLMESDPKSHFTQTEETVTNVKSITNNESNKKIAVTTFPDKKEYSYMEGFNKGNDEINGTAMQHQWLEKSKGFRLLISNINDKATEVPPIKEATVEVPPIKIAIIDNGIDATLSIFDNKIETGASFFPVPNTADVLYHPYYMTSGTLNHGSLVAMLVCTMCPKVKLYICRLNEIVSPMGARYITTDSAAKAIEWATDQKVDVICMSWTIEENVNNSDAQNRLETALDRADNNGKGITMVSSASDQGGNSTKTWPGESGKCIRIGASTPNGDKSFQVHQRDMDFLFPGESIPLGANEEHLPAEKTYDGSSFATAIAAGTAGLLLYLDRLAEKYGEKTEGKEWISLKGRSTIKKMFEMMSTARNNGPSLEMFNKLQFDETSFGYDLGESCTKLRTLLSPLKTGYEYYGQN